MAETIEHRDDHILVISETPGPAVYRENARMTYAIECPNEAKGPQGAWGKCAYLDQCGCDELYRKDADAVELILSRLGIEDELESPQDWIDGTFWSLGVVGEPGWTKVVRIGPPSAAMAASVRLTVEAHEDCPTNKQPHSVWEGEIMTPTGECAFRGELQNIGTDAIEWALELPPGRYPVKGEWDDPYSFYIERITS